MTEKKIKNKKHILLGVTGSIAAYKTAELVRLIIKQNWDVSVIMTEAATRFVSELTFRTLSRRPVVTDIFEKVTEWEPRHISLADSSDVLLIAPCTANVIAKLAHGIADDALTAVALACRSPLIIAPAMNENMWNHPATRENISVLKSRGAEIIDVERGELANGYKGMGRMAPVETIMAVLKKAIKTNQMRTHNTK